MASIERLRATRQSGTSNRPLLLLPRRYPLRSRNPVAAHPPRSQPRPRSCIARSAAIDASSLPHVPADGATGPAATTPTAAPTPAAANPLDLRHGLLLAHGQPELRAALEDFPHFSGLVDIHQTLLDKLVGALGVAPARSKHTGPDGVLRVQSLMPGVAAFTLRSYRCPSPSSSSPSSASTSPSPQPLRCMTHSFGRLVFPDGSRRVYTKLSASPLDDSLTPQLDVEIGGTATEFTFFAALAPKLPLTADLSYLDRYYNNPPPQLAAAAAAASHAGGAGAAGSADSGGNGVGGHGSGAAQQPALPSFKQLEAEARQQPGFAPFVSRSLWVRALSAGALAFTIRWHPTDNDHPDAAAENARLMSLLHSYASTLTDIWLAHLTHDSAVAAAAAAGGGAGPATDPRVVAQCQHASEVLRNSVRYDPDTRLMYPLFGEAAVNAMLDTVGGEEWDG